jgi:hypothetical protein
MPKAFKYASHGKKYWEWAAYRQKSEYPAQLLFNSQYNASAMKSGAPTTKKLGTFIMPSART